MKSSIIKSRFGPLLALVLAVCLISTSCGGDKEASLPTAAAGGDCDINKIPIARTSFSVTDGPAAKMAREISQGVGSVIAADNGREDRIVIAFEETHNSRAGQIEIAIMLLRLYINYNLRQVSLEGAIAGDMALSPSWFHKLTADRDSSSDGQQLAVKLLKDGEINCGEFTSFVLPDVQVKGNEKAEEYNVAISDNAAKAVSDYLINIAEKSLTPAKISQIEQLFREKRIKEAADLLFGSDPWVKEHYEKLMDKTSITSVEESVKALQEIEAKAKASGINVSQEDRSGLQEMVKFFRTAGQRSCTMVANTFAMCDQSPKAPVGFIIGAAHTQKVIELLKAGGASFAVISPSSLATNLENGTLTAEAYKRKNAGKSVDPPGYLGAYLDRRHKPPVITGQKWLKTKSEVGLLSIDLAKAAAGGDKPPYDNLKERFKRFQNIVVVPGSIQPVEGNNETWLICSIKAATDSGEVELWVGGAMQPPQPPGGPPGTSFIDPDSERDPNKRLLKMLEESLAEAKQEKAVNIEKPNPDPSFVSKLTTKTKIGISKSGEFLKEMIRRK